MNDGLYDQRILQNDWGILSLKVGLVQLAVEHWNWAFTGVNGEPAVVVQLDPWRTVIKPKEDRECDSTFK